jgi:hypothetical protein
LRTSLSEEKWQGQNGLLFRFYFKELVFHRLFKELVKNSFHAWKMLLPTVQDMPSY